ncbi:RNA polymerase sigma factor [Catalinimonas sp. 4WD22]|uniref:RNA polymerase sigma factor n=1 Tax=Catalinimonas locisalis TaxID=3133978 RepID=UPI003100AC4B
MDSSTDNAIMLKVKSGDLEKMGLLFERHHRPLFGFYYRMCQDAELSEDLVQNLFLRMIKYRHTFTGEGKFTSWMYHLARNLLADHYRKKKKMTTDNFKEVEKMWEDEAAQEAQEEREKLLEKAMQYLSDDKREVLVLSRYQGLRYQEIADMMNTSEANIKVKVYRAIRELKEIFQKLERFSAL